MDTNSSIVWMQWLNKKHNTVTAHAVDQAAPLKNGILRAVNGSVIPAGAILADATTPRDPFCIKLLEDRATAKPKGKKAAKAKPELDIPVTYGVHMECNGPDASIKYGPNVLGVFPRARLANVRTQARLSATHWGVYQDKKRVAFGKLPDVKPVGLELPQTVEV